MFQSVNVVLTAELKCAIDFKNLARNISNIVYNPRVFSAAILKSKKIHSTCLLFKNGKVVCCGAATIAIAKKSLRQWARKIQKMGYTVQLCNVTLQTMTLIFNLGEKINLPNFCALQNDASYEQELFPAAMVKLNKINFTIFQSGKVIISGVKNIKVVEGLFLPILLNMKISTF
jgi:transcription initiation factor TFIID TATA-box-binding protein